ncbi:PBSX family phage terminase large subunit [Fusobacterium sp.]|uniref:PBSX family phage terminase large subunit n=1 Tax=Fusobacterium nucleatum TaxID=851 RepID=A0A323TWD0_FUSNU|nr:MULTISPECIES: PBSX family phage terminase large subunit [Fusobacterium]PCR85686.1 PBSX family phage terminase large subunit [Fusobacterium nucleatum]PZA04533.1 PBSX family phage terminase large subunit [Fusobacterium nucleatum]QJX49633.1 PBSX family phage terminase large subunit [Fusobacterium nucleatum]HCE32932.1 PBSX family phage terminase large subunit [Fusobacterium sp.]
MTSKKKRKQLKISDLLTPKFYPLYSAWKSNKYTRLVCKGGRGSAKSTNIALILVVDLMQYPVSTICFRKVGETLRKSVYEQIKWAIKFLGVEEYFEYKLSPLEIIYKERGNKFIFMGVDDPQKSKSIKEAQFPVARYWFEELAEFKNEDEVETVLNSIFRGKLEKGLIYKGFFSYNPPKMKHNWVNKKYNYSFIENNVYVHHSTYLENPYISEEFIKEAEAVKEKDETKYRLVYMGEPIGNGLVPFPNLEIREIEASEIAGLEKFRNGVDWGYGVDPLAFVRWGYDKKKGIIYALDEFYGVGLKNRNLANYILSKGYDELVMCDSAEPKSIDELKEYDISAWGAKKGAGSVEYGEKWLSDLEAIVIDPKRTPNISREFEMIDYDTDREGNPLPRLVDKNNHTIDATRYAFSNDMKKGKWVYEY